MLQSKLGNNYFLVLLFNKIQNSSPLPQSEHICLKALYLLCVTSSLKLLWKLNCRNLVSCSFKKEIRLLYRLKRSLHQSSCLFLVYSYSTSFANFPASRAREGLLKPGLHLGTQCVEDEEDCQIIRPLWILLLWVHLNSNKWRRNKVGSGDQQPSAKEVFVVASLTCKNGAFSHTWRKCH